MARSRSVHDQQAHWLDVDPQSLTLALARLPTRLRQACKLFHELTGLIAVVSLRRGGEPIESAASMPPPVHPVCAVKIRANENTPCNAQWGEHIRHSLRTRSGDSHVCPLGLRCACVPILLGDALVGVAKVVVESTTPRATFSATTATLALAVSASCQEMLVQILSEELESLRRRVAGLRNVRQRGLPSTDSAAAEASPSRVAQGSIVYRALDHLHRNYTDPDMCLTLVASALECNGNYLTQRFTQLVGQRMHGYIVSLRVQRVSRELVSTDLPIKRIAYESGFRDAAGLTRTFRRQVGVSPTEYRRIFRT